MAECAHLPPVGILGESRPDLLRPSAARGPSCPLWASPTLKPLGGATLERAKFVNNKMTVLSEIRTNGWIMYFLKLMNDPESRIVAMSYGMMISAVFVVLLLQCTKLNAAYGRYSSASWGFMVPGRLAWFVQELPSFAWIAYYLLWSDVTFTKQTANVILMLLFFVHYFQRTFVFTYLIRGGKPTPFSVFLAALAFCLYNGYMQGCFLATIAKYPSDWFTSPAFLCGISIFLCGMMINIHSDHILRNLRKPGEKGYKIPQGGLFEYVSGANFFGEIMEWWGFALASWSLPAFAFAVFTTSNIGPRALAHHEWYLTKFGSDYPRHRRALIPGLL